MISLTVIIPTHNPDLGRLRRSLDGLAMQSFAPEHWETIIVDNASHPAVVCPKWEIPVPIRILRHTELGLTSARIAGIQEARGEIVVFVDDDNVLAPDYLESVSRAFGRLPKVGAIGGRSLPEFETTPEPWTKEFFPLLALRDLGDDEQIFSPPDQPSELHRYPPAAPIGAGLALRRCAIAHWLMESSRVVPDRVGTELSSGGDNQIVLSVLQAGYTVGYIPELVLIHLIPSTRLQPDYLARLNFGIQKSWMQVLTVNGVNSWPPLNPRTIPLRKLKAWFVYRAWHDAAARIRWRGACGHFEGRIR